MASVSRRGFLWQTSAAGVAAAGVLAIGGGALAAKSTATDVASPASLASVGEPVVAYIRNAAAGEIALHIGEREILFTDAALVARLLKSIR